MGLGNRPYMDGGGETGGGALSLGLPRPTRAVKLLLLINVAVFVAQTLWPNVLESVLGVTGAGAWQVWRYLTFQFLHGGVWHIALNMLGLYMLGAPLEGLWGTRRFVAFYLSCGVAAGVAYVLIGVFGHLPPWIPLIGASGGVYAIVLACAVLFPHFQIIFILFPVPIRLAAIVIFGAMVLVVLGSLRSGNFVSVMSDVAHLGGAVAGAVWIWVVPRLRDGLRLGERMRQGAWKRRMEALAREQQEVDRILKKVHDEGLQSLTGKEKRFLQDATKRQQQRDRRTDRM